MKKLSFAIVSLGLCAALGCNQIADINDPLPKDAPGGGTTPAGTSTGNPPGGGENPPPGTTPPAGGDSSKFVGDWTSTTNVTFANCTNGAPSPLSGSGPIKVTASAKGIQLVDGPTCAVEFTVSGEVATAIAGSECSNETNPSFMFWSTIANGSLTLTNATTGTLRLNGTTDMTINGIDTTCEYAQTSQLKKGS